MNTMSTANRQSLVTATIGFRVTCFCLIVSAAWLEWTGAALAIPYNFMSVSGTNIPGNGTTVSTFTSGLG